MVTFVHLAKFFYLSTKVNIDYFHALLWINIDRYNPRLKHEISEIEILF